MSSHLLDFDSYYKSPKDTHNQPFPANAAYKPRTDELYAGLSPSSTNNWQHIGQSQWSAQASRPSIVSRNVGRTASTSNPGQNANDPFSCLDSLSNTFLKPGPKPSSSVNNSAFPKLGIMRQSTSSFFDSHIAISRQRSFERFDGPIADYIDEKQKQQQLRNDKLRSPALPSSLRNEVPSMRPEVLFDADDELEASSDEDDFGDFGDFETATSGNLIDDISSFSSGNIGDLSGISMPLEANDSSSVYTNNYPKPPKSPSFRERNPFSDLVLATTQISEKNVRARDLTSADFPTPTTAWPIHDEHPIKSSARKEPSTKEIEEDWGDFLDLPPETPDAEVDKTKTDWSWGTQVTTAVQERNASDSPPPTNIPPPSILLPIFQQLFDLPRSSLFQPVANQPFSLKHRIYSDPSTIDFLRGYLLISVVAARILAGRKLRWKRDHHLSQAMKIGLAGGKGGLKLTGIDKAESAREDREAADTVQIWKEQLGRLRSAVIVANSSLSAKSNLEKGSGSVAEKKGKILIIPEINEVVSVKSAGVSEGAISDPKICVLCGIKREERITKVDVAVEDSFGEFWVEHWGHFDCRNFWREHSVILRQR